MSPFLFLVFCLSAGNAAKLSAQAGSRRALPAQETTRAAKPKAGPRVWGDLLQKYAAKPAGVTLVGCRAGQPGGQTVAIATYQVSGANAAGAEQFFRAHYGMGSLVFVCCGWEPAAGKSGQLASATLRKINPNYALLITMYSDAQTMEKTLLHGGSGAYRDKRKVPLFIIEAKVVDV
ncbi:MAG: DUF4952 domain-containing protein [Hymenobacter sp.]|nr:MAG: DUF4952 domain-containing protein [Hymenobacter sp.]